MSVHDPAKSQQYSVIFAKSAADTKNRMFFHDHALFMADTVRAKGLSGCHSSEQQPRQPDGGPEGQIKGLLSRHITLRKES
jgi:hypothetical protein